MEVYRLTEQFPADERFELRSQLRRAVVSIGSNIVEGAGYGTRSGFARHLRIARGSNAEVEYQMRLACRVGYLTEDEYAVVRASCEDLRKMLTGLIRSLQ